MSPSNVEGQHTGEFILSEAMGSRSRENVVVLSGQNLKAGAVVGRVAMGVGKAAIPTVVGTGDGTMSALFAGPDVEVGAYVVKCTEAIANGGVFSVTAPSGKVLPSLTLTVGAGATTKYRSSHINFSITDGSANFALNDTFTITVATGAPTVVGTGNGTISGLSLGRKAKTGRYVITCIAAGTNTGTFQCVDPDGDIAWEATITGGAGGTAVVADHEQLNATITDGSTDFGAGAFFEVFVFNQLVKKCVAWDPTTFDGRHQVAGVLYDNVDASAADADGVIVAREAEVRAADLQWAAAITAAEQEVAKAEMADALGIVAR